MKPKVGQLTEEEKKAMLRAFHEDKAEEEPDPWTPEAIAKVAEKILERMQDDRRRVENHNG